MKQSTTMSVAGAVRAWLDAESAAFTAMCGERVTRREVIKCVIGLTAFLMATGVAGGV